MKKTLIALAALAATSASFAQSSVTLYGIVDLAVGHVSANNGGNSTSVVDSGTLSGSRWGMRGSEDLGGGMNAVFVLESGFNADSGVAGQGGLLFGRNSFVGLNGGFGSVTVGRQYGPVFYVGAGGDVDGYSNTSPVTNAFLLASNASGLPYRVNNSVIYKTPSMGGLTASLMYGMGEVAGSSSAGRAVAGNIEYANGPIYAGLAVDERTNASAVKVARLWALSGAYDLGVAKVAGIAGEFHNPSSSAPKAKAYAIGVRVPMNPFALVAQVGQIKKGSAKATLWNLGADYNLSKRTNLYARYAISDNNNSGQFDLAGVAGNSPAGTYSALAVGQDRSALMLGIRHRF